MKLIRVFALGFILMAVPQSYAYGESNDVLKEMNSHDEGATWQGSGGKYAKKDAYDFIRQSDAEAVTVKVDYTNPGEKVPVFSVALDTHSVDLDRYRFDEIIFLRDDAGAVYSPEILSAGGSGHHREAKIKFSGFDASRGGSFEIVLKGVEGAEERVFRFAPGRSI